MNESVKIQPKTIEVYECPKCGKLYRDEYIARICCKQYHCEVCNAPTPKCWLICDTCKEKRDYCKAKKMTIDEYEKQYSGNMVAYSDTYYDDVEMLLECDAWSSDNPPPSYCWGTEKVPVELDADTILDELIENANVDDLEFSRDAYDEFRKFANIWNKKHGQYYFYENKDIAILIPEDMRHEYIQESQ